MTDSGLLDSLNEEQRAAVTAPDGPVLVIAAAGTGKTRTLVHRVAWLVQQGVNPQEMLLLTFTNRAAAEMLERARDLAGPAVSGLWGGTFHHMANRMLRRHAELLDYRSDFTILDEDDQRSLIKNVIQEKGHTDKTFPKGPVLLSLLSLSVNTGKDLEDLIQDRFAHHPANTDHILETLVTYQERKKEINAMDFDDLLTYCLQLLLEHEHVRTHYQERFRYILVDEYQDTNLIQAKLVDILASKHRNVLVVGDDFQSIYSWRGADYRNIIEFPEKYADTSVFKLETNYRSSPEILDVANACIAHNPKQFQKTLKAVKPASVVPKLVQPRNGDDQARFIIHELRQLQYEGYNMNQIAVLYRSHFHSMELQLELSRNGIPYQITSGMRFFEQAHVKDVCSLLRILNNPGDELAFLRLMELLPKVGSKTAQKVWLHCGKRVRLDAGVGRLKILDALPKGAKPLWEEIHKALGNLEEDRLLGDTAEVVHAFIECFYDEYAVNNFDNYPRRLEDLQELIRYVGQFDSLQQFLDEMALLTNMDREQETGAEDAPKIRLSTVHQAKGLEWDVVFMVWLADGMFPSGKSIEEPEGEEEERRLFYVATTRAREKLFLMAPQSRRQRDGGMVFYSSSRFIRELPSGSCEKVHGTFF